MGTLDPFINRRVVVLHRNDTIYQASRAMHKNNIGCVIVSDQDGYVVGVVTDRDVACSISSLDSSQDWTLDTVMKTGLIWATEKDSLKDVIGLMISNSVRRVPIVRHTTRGRVKCVGFVSLDDLIIQDAITVREAAEIIKSQVKPRQRRPSRQLFRSQARKNQTEADFCRHLSQETGLREDDAREATFCFLETLFRRISPGAANDLVSQLPVGWKEYLRAFMTGPDRRVKAHELVGHLAEVLHFTDKEAKRLAKRIFTALSELTAGNTMEHLIGQLPSEFQELFEGGEFPSPPRRLAEETRHWY